MAAAPEDLLPVHFRPGSAYIDDLFTKQSGDGQNMQLVELGSDI